LYTLVLFCNSEVRMLYILGQLFFTQHTYSIYYHYRSLSLIIKILSACMNYATRAEQFHATQYIHILSRY